MLVYISTYSIINEARAFDVGNITQSISDEQREMRRKKAIKNKLVALKCTKSSAYLDPMSDRQLHECNTLLSRPRISAQHGLLAKKEIRKVVQRGLRGKTPRKGLRLK